MARKPPLLRITGRTQDGKITVAGIGQLFFQEGLPLSVTFDRLLEANMIPSWLDLYKELKDNGYNHSRIIHTLNEHVFESFGKEFRDIVVDRLEKLYRDKNIHQ